MAIPTPFNSYFWRVIVLPDGRYLGGIRPHHLTVETGDTTGTVFPAVISLTEVTGSETYIPAEVGEDRIIALVHGVRRHETVQRLRQPSIRTGGDGSSSATDDVAAVSEERTL